MIASPTESCQDTVEYTKVPDPKTLKSRNFYLSQPFLSETWHHTNPKVVALVEQLLYKVYGHKVSIIWIRLIRISEGVRRYLDSLSDSDSCPSFPQPTPPLVPTSLFRNYLILFRHFPYPLVFPQPIPLPPSGSRIPSYDMYVPPSVPVVPTSGHAHRVGVALEALGVW